MMAGSTGVIPCIKVVAKTDFTKNIEKLDVVMPILHGEGQERNRAPFCSSHYQGGQKIMLLTVAGARVSAGLI